MKSFNRVVFTNISLTSMAKESLLDSDKIVYSLEDEDEETKRARGCATSYLVDERETSGKLPPKFRQRWFRAASMLALVSFISAVGFSIASIIISQTTESSAVFATGFDAFFAAINVVAVCWRFRDELNGEIGTMREKKASTVIATSFILGGIATIVIALHNLQIDDHPTKTDEMKVVLGVGALLYAILTFLQCYVAQLVNSQSMRALAVDSAQGAFMSVGVLVSTYVYTKFKQFWYLDHVVATIVGVVSLIYGINLFVEILGLNIKERLMLAFQREF